MNFNKFKISSVIFIVSTLFGVIAICCTNESEKTEELTNTKPLQETGSILDKMTVEQLMNYKNNCEESIARINTELGSDSLNPEEKHELIICRGNITNELESIKNYLQR